MFQRVLRQIHPSWVFYTLVYGVICGIVFSLVCSWTFTSIIWVVMSGLLISLSFYRPCPAAITLAIIAGFLIGNFRLSAPLTSKELVQNFINQSVIIAGNLLEDPDTNKGNVSIRLQNLRLYYPSVNNSSEATQLVENFSKTVENSVNNSVENLVKSDTFLPLTGVLYVTISNQTDLERSDLVVLQGKLGEGFGTFLGKMSRPKLLAIERSSPGDIFAQFKHWFADAAREFVPSPEVDLGLGYLMGMKSGLSEDFSATLQAVGMTHVVVASGAHLAILTGSAKKLFGKISKFASLLFSLLLIVAFVLIVGFTPSMTRAALVASLSLIMGYVGRRFTPMRLISFVAMVTLLIEPTYLLNLGWQLSFASFFGLLVLGPRLQKTFYGGKHPPWLASMLLTSISTSLVCAPILIFNFGSLSLLSLVANLVILPTLPYAMLGMMLVGTFSFAPFLAQLIAYPTIWILDLHIWLVNYLSEKSMFILEIPSGDPRIYLLYIPVLVYLVIPKLIPKLHKTVTTQAANAA